MDSICAFLAAKWQKTMTATFLSVMLNSADIFVDKRGKL
jgi:hypothetical protein